MPGLAGSFFFLFSLNYFLALLCLCCFFSVDILLKLILLLMLLLLLLVHYCAGVGRCFPFLVLSKLFSNFCLFVCVVRLLFSKKIVFLFIIVFNFIVVVAVAATVVCYPHKFQDGCDDPL